MRTTYAKRKLGDRFGDSRLSRRFTKICSLFEEGLSRTIPQTGQTKSSTKAMYRFFDNNSVTPQRMIAAHNASFRPELSTKSVKRFLQVSDTVELDYTGTKAAQDLGPLNYVKRKGMLLHNSLIFSDEGIPLGLFWQSYHIRRDEDFGKSAERFSLPFEYKEGFRWQGHFERGQSMCREDPSLELIYIGDREADIIDLFQARAQPRMHLIIRSKHNRLLADRSDHLYNALAGQPVKGTYQISIRHPVYNRERTAHLEVRTRKVTLTQHRQTRNKPNRKKVTLYAVEAKEINPPPGITKPVHWVLLTTLPVHSFAQALEVIHYYSHRWLIERFHYILKSGGAKVEELQLETAHRLKNAVTAYSIAAIGVLKIRYWAEKSPKTDIYKAGISPLEHEVLYTYANKNIDRSIVFERDQPPSIEQYCRVLGQIGGFLPSKRQLLPGFKILTRATEKLNVLVDAYLIFCQRTE